MIEFLEREHLYLVNGVITPSVSEILKFIFPEKYKGVPTNILNAKADYGSVVHEAIEKIENDEELPKLDYIQEASIKQYFKLKEKYNIAVLEQEKMVNYQGRYAGRFDMIANINGLTSLCDIKTTATLDKEYLSWQLSFYELLLVPIKAGDNPSGYFKYYDYECSKIINGKKADYYRVYKGSSEYDTHEMSVFIDGVIQECQDVGIETLPPHEISLLKEEWQ